MTQRLLLLPCFFLFSLTGFSQDIFFTNSNQSLIYLNPSFAGSNGFIRSQNIYRIQDVSARFPKKTFYGSVDAFITPLQSGLAFSYLDDNQGKGHINTRAMSFAYAQHLYLFDNVLKIMPAVQLGYFIKSLDVDAVKFNDTLDTRRNTTWPSGYSAVLPTSTKSNVDGSASLLAQTKNLTVGVAVFHLNQPDQGLLGPEPLPARINIHASYIFDVAFDVKASVFALYMNQPGIWDSYLNANFIFDNEFFVGAGIRRSHAITFNAGFQVDAFRLGVGYDYGFNPSNRAVYGKHSLEAMVSFNFTNKRSENSPFAEWLLW